MTKCKCHLLAFQHWLEHTPLWRHTQVIATYCETCIHSHARTHSGTHTGLKASQVNGNVSQARISTHTRTPYLCAVALAAQVWVCGLDGLGGRAAVYLRAGRGAVGYGRTGVVCQRHTLIRRQKLEKKISLQRRFSLSVWFSEEADCISVLH